MNKTVKKIFVDWKKFMPKQHLRRSRCIYSACGLVTKHRENNQKFRETQDLNYNHKSNKHCFAHDVVSCVGGDLVRRTVSDTILKDRA